MRDRPQATTAPLAGSPCRGDRFPRSMQEPEPSSRHLHAGRHPGSQQAPPRLIPGLQSIPGFDVTFVFRHVISGSLSLAFLAHTCRAQRRDFPATLTTTALNRSSSRRFAASACTAAAEGHQTNHTRLLHLLHSTASRPGLLHPASFNVRGTPRDDQRLHGVALRDGRFRPGDAGVCGRQHRAPGIVPPGVASWSANERIGCGIFGRDSPAPSRRWSPVIAGLRVRLLVRAFRSLHYRSRRVLVNPLSSGGARGKPAAATRLSGPLHDRRIAQHLGSELAGGA